MKLLTEMTPRRSTGWSRTCLDSGTTSSSVPIKGKDGEALLTDKQQEARWVEHFSDVMHQPTPTDLFHFDVEEAGCVRRYSGALQHHRDQ